MSDYYDVESLVKEWLLTTPLAALTQGGVSIFKAMPLGSPKPSVVLSRVGGAPARGVDMPQDVARMSFDCWGNARAEAAGLAVQLTWLIETLAPGGGYVGTAGRLAVAETISSMWLADKASDTPRYVVDALFTVIPG